MIKTLIVKDNLYVSKYLQQLIESDGKFRLEGILTDAFDAEKVCEEREIDLILMDVQTKDNHSGLAAGRRIKAKRPNVKIVIVTSLIDPEVLKDAKSGAADSLWYKDHGSVQIMNVVQKTLNGENVFPDESPNVTLKDIFSADLSKKQMDILRMFVKGYTYSEMAKEIGLTSHAVRWHLDQIVEKGGFENKHELLAKLLDSKLIVTTLNDGE